jgi:nickel-dependent lactate racemase
MRIRLAYGHDGLDLEVDPARTDVVRPRHRPALADPAAALRAACRHPVAGPPLRDRVPKGSRVAISVCDGTRAQPRHLMVPAVLAELDGLVDLDDVVILVATGTHRGNTDAELRAMLGDEVVDSVRVLNHDARDADSLVDLGVHGDGVSVSICRHWCEADVRITTGFVEPHFFAGFSGGPKMVVPGLAGLDTVLELHNARRIGSPSATWGITHGNPVHDDIRAVVAAVGGVTFALDVLLDDQQRIVAAFGGDLEPMHAAACAQAKATAMAAVPAPYDVVVTTGSGHPLDQNLYQSVKGMSAGAAIAAPGARILTAAACADGFPDHGSYRQLLAGADSPQALLDSIAAQPHTRPDQWQVQIQARLSTQAALTVATDGLTAAELAQAHLRHVPADPDAVSAWVAQALTDAGPSARCCVLPEGPQTVPYVAG